MTTQEKQMIASLSENGLGYRKNAAQIGISENTVKSYLKRMTAAVPFPGSERFQNPGRFSRNRDADIHRG